jgi:POT family proton-dependent oligopeptide transporter
MIFNQPRGLFLLFFSELWERFGNMTILSLLVLYLTHHFNYSDTYAYLLSGAFGAFIYITPVPGGTIAGGYIGYQRAIMLGAIILALGYFTIATSSNVAFFAGLSLLVLGTGFFKPNVSSIVGDLYEANDPRRDSGFTLFYMGINIGSLLPPLFIGKLVATYGYAPGFMIAGAGMLISLSIFVFGRKRLAGCGGIPRDSVLNRSASERRRFKILFILGLIVTAAITYGALHIPQFSSRILILAGIIIAAYVLWITAHLRGNERKGILVCLILTLISVGFWSIYMQIFTSLLLFADRNMSTQFLGMTINANFTTGFNPFFIILLSPLLSVFWPWLNKQKFSPSYPMKFALGTLFVGLGHLCIATAIHYFSPNGLTSPWWLVLSYFMQTVGELLLSPIGLAMITVLTPKKYVGMMMGVWFLALAAAFAVGGELATIASVPRGSDLLTSQHIYMNAFYKFGALGIGLAVVALLLVPALKKMVPSLGK